jgi:hypothetical protein
MRRFAWLVIGVFLPLLASAANIMIPAQPLGSSLQELAKQSGIQIIFFSKLVEGQQAPALNGSFEPAAAVAILLEGTDLMYQVLNDRAMQIIAKPLAAAAPWAQLPDPPPDGPMDEVRIEGRYQKLSEMKAEIENLEGQFYAAYNKLNPMPQYNIACQASAPLGSHIVQRRCRPLFISQAAELKSESFVDAQGRVLVDGSSNVSSPAIIQQQMQAYQKNMIDIVRKHPELLQLLEERSALAERYQALLNKKLKKKPFLSDRAVGR